MWLEVNKEILQYQALQAKRKKANEVWAGERRRVRDHQKDNEIWAETQRCGWQRQRRPAAPVRPAAARSDLACSSSDTRSDLACSSRDVLPSRNSFSVRDEDDLDMDAALGFWTSAQGGARATSRSPHTSPRIAPLDHRSAARCAARVAIQIEDLFN